MKNVTIMTLTLVLSPISFSYKIWHYTGALMHKRVCGEKENLLSISWQPGTYAKTDLSRTAPKGIEDATPKATGAYRPPGARNRPSTFTLHEHEKPHRPGQTIDGKQRIFLRYSLGILEFFEIGKTIQLATRTQSPSSTSVT